MKFQFTRPVLDTQQKRRRYERSAVILLALGFGLVGLDRWIITPLFPAIMADLDLGYDDLGNIVGILGLTWGVSALFMGRLSDKFGRRRIMVPGIILFFLVLGLQWVGNRSSLTVARASLDGYHRGRLQPYGCRINSRSLTPRTPRFQYGPPTEHLRIVWDWARPHHRHPATRALAELAVGVCHHDHPRPDSRVFYLARYP